MRLFQRPATEVKPWSALAAHGTFRSMRFLGTGLWADVRELPEALEATVAAADGVEPAAEQLRSAGARRIVATGNGAAYYVAHALWLAALESAGDGPPVVAVPCGVAARGSFRWRAGDAVLAVSSSGEFRDVVEIARAAGGRPCVAVTAQADSSLARAASASVVQRVASQRAVTHTQALAGAYACTLALWAAVTGDEGLRSLVEGAAAAAATAVEQVEAWASSRLPALDPPAAARAARRAAARAGPPPAAR